jgi:hypothetical protein
MPFRRRHHRWIAFLALVGLLFQQLAMASYVCPVESGASTAVMTPAKVPPCHVSGSSTDKARCQQHCFPQPLSPEHPPMPTVPAMLPATTWLPVPDDCLLQTHGMSVSRLVAKATAPPLTIQHCTFQI